MLPDVVAVIGELGCVSVVLAVSEQPSWSVTVTVYFVLATTEEGVAASQLIKE